MHGRTVTLTQTSTRVLSYTLLLLLAYNSRKPPEKTEMRTIGVLAAVLLIQFTVPLNSVEAQIKSKVVCATTDIAKGTAFAPENVGLRDLETNDPAGGCTAVSSVYGWKANCAIARKQVILRTFLSSAAPPTESEVWVAKTDIKQGDLLSPENSELRRIPSSQVPPGFLDGATKPQGRQTQVSIKAGDPLTETMLFSQKPISDLHQTDR